MQVSSQVAKDLDLDGFCLPFKGQIPRPRSLGNWEKSGKA